MHRDDFERLIDQVVRPQPPHPCGAKLPGGSPAMRALAEDVKEVRAALTLPPAQHRCGVVFLHPPAPLWLGLELLKLCGVPATATCELHPRSPVYNGGLLFGQICLPGRFEAGGPGVVGVAGLTGLGDGQFPRLRAHLEAWWSRLPDEARHHLVMTAQEYPPLAQAAQAAGARIIRVAPLSERPEDFPHVLHALALLRHGSLADFDADALKLLEGHRWERDLQELDEIVERLYPPDRGGQDSVNVERVRESLRDRQAPEPLPEICALWDQVRTACRSCDDQTKALVGAPFFEPAANETDPFDDPSPRGQFFRIISWAYQRFYESAKTNLEFLWGARQATCPGDVAQTKRLHGFINRFRHYQQHYAPAGRPGYQDIQQWMSNVCGQEIPAPWQHELCVRAVLGEIRQLAEAVGRLLDSVANESDEGRQMLTDQWQERLNLSWSPQRRRDFICERLMKVAGWRVNPRPVADQWLTPVQEYLRSLRHRPEEERLAALTQWLDAQLKNDPDSQPLVKGDDLMDLGVPPTKRKDLLAELQRGQLQGLSRDELLERARSAAE